ncbi:DUF58 domain-containing protein [Natrinema salaciae]|uniref:Uncharacterized conserved protein, DUF58 family, contains vWF domain n=1 Tax=Natrinema salaciae TaxID=1186196 RepID=A0A1H9N042_9EURY|nr:DUF58 domain-containing protein [Natrinema salaciae]SER29201.1 Uncharacterized conserved protein, DUF58 family, contains vWF domain [Natrinema salaciae]
MRLTRRGWAVVTVVCGAVLLSWQFGPRALNAVVVPLVVVLLAGLVTAGRTTRPRVTRHSVAEGFIGEERRVEIAISTDRAVAATVTDAVGDGLSATTDPVIETTLDGDETVAYDVRLERRGERRVGPLSITVTDVVGLVERRFEYEASTPVLVYPRVRDLGRGPATDIQALAGVADRHVHDEFDHLREYRRGDPLRDVHWKSAAKRPTDDLVVTEYADDEEVGAVTVAAECRSDRDDEMASAAASVATYLLELGATVGLVVPDGTLPPESGRNHHRELLGLLAVTTPGELETQTKRDADVLVRTDADGTTVVVDDRDLPFDRLCGRGRRRSARDEQGESASERDGRADRETDSRRGTAA